MPAAVRRAVGATLALRGAASHHPVRAIAGVTRAREHHRVAGPGRTSDEILAGLGLVVILGVASQLVARRLRLPAIVVLLPVGFLAGIVTDDVHPDQLLGDLFQPFVSLAVGV